MAPNWRKLTDFDASPVVTPTFHLSFHLVLFICVWVATVAAVLSSCFLAWGAPGRLSCSGFRRHLFTGCCVPVHGVHFHQAESLQQTHRVKVLFRVLVPSPQELQYLTGPIKTPMRTHPTCTYVRCVLMVLKFKLISIILCSAPLLRVSSCVRQNW